MPEAFETFVRDPSDLVDGEETVLVLRDLTPGRRKYFAHNVVAIVTRSPGPSEEFLPLRVRSMVGNLVPGQWFVKITEVLPQRVPGTPYTNVFDAMKAVWGKQTAR